MPVSCRRSRTNPFPNPLLANPTAQPPRHLTPTIHNASPCRLFLPTCHNGIGDKELISREKILCQPSSCPRCQLPNRRLATIAPPPNPTYTRTATPAKTRVQSGSSEQTQDENRHPYPPFVLCDCATEPITFELKQLASNPPPTATQSASPARFRGWLPFSVAATMQKDSRNNLTT